MANLSTSYLGLKLKNPIVVSSCELTNSLENIQKMEAAGAGAVVLKSIFEEQIVFESDKFIDSSDASLSPMKKGLQDILDNRSYDYVEAMEYMTNFAKEHTLKEYLDFIKLLKSNVKIPIIASINCVSAYDWSFFAKRIQEAGADALELNIFILPSDITKTSANYDEMYKKIIQDVKRFVTIPVALKLSYYSSSLVHRFVELSNSGIAGIVLFNKPYNPDIDIHKIEISTGKILSSESDYLRSLRWTAILSGRVGCDLASSTGVHSYETVVKMLLAGSNAVQVASLLYEKGIGEITHLVDGLNKWMDEHNFNTIDEFRGKLSQKNIENPAVLERVQFMKSYAGIN
ncbi:MAG: dihydroorotate dehydrogenase-like protein [Bacteroidetes bacterium]|nr:dihydroorotate dehydrogenase-like protein [Bacteroidota bacterium]